MQSDEQVYRVGSALQPLASSVELFLEELTGDRLGFVLVISVAKTMQYVSNTDRYAGAELLRELLNGWDRGRADIPGTINPDLKEPLLQYDVLFAHRTDETEIQFTRIAAHSVAYAEAAARSRLAVPDAWHCTGVHQSLP